MSKHNQFERRYAWFLEDLKTLRKNEKTTEQKRIIPIDLYMQEVKRIRERNKW